MARSHDPECRPEIVPCRLREVSCNRRHIWALTPCIEDRVKLLRHNYAQGCLHANAAVLQLCSAVRGNVTIFRKSSWVPEAQWFSDAGQIFGIDACSSHNHLLTQFLQLGLGLMVQLRKLLLGLSSHGDIACRGIC